MGMVRRGSTNHIAIRWSGYGAEGDTWEVEGNVYPASKISEFKENFTVELGEMSQSWDGCTGKCMLKL